MLAFWIVTVVKLFYFAITVYNFSVKVSRCNSKLESVTITVTMSCFVCIFYLKFYNFSVRVVTLCTPMSELLHVKVPLYIGELCERRLGVEKDYDEQFRDLLRSI